MTTPLPASAPSVPTPAVAAPGLLAGTLPPTADAFAVVLGAAGAPGAPGGLPVLPAALRPVPSFPGAPVLSTGVPVPVAPTVRPAAVANPAAGFGVQTVAPPVAPPPPGTEAAESLGPDRAELEAMLAWFGPAAMPPAPPSAPVPADPLRAPPPSVVLPPPPAVRADAVSGEAPPAAEAAAAPAVAPWSGVAAAPLPVPAVGTPRAVATPSPSVADSSLPSAPGVPAAPPPPSAAAPTAGAGLGEATAPRAAIRPSAPPPVPAAAWAALRPDAPVAAGATRPAPGPRAPAAIPAAAVAAPPPADSAGRTGAEINPASADFPSVKVERVSAGTGVAHPVPDMRPELTDSALTPPPAAVTVELQETVATKADTPALAAHRAVAAVVDLLDAQAAAREPAAAQVALRLKVGDEELAVRIELRDGEVRTEFRTASPELRAALAHEWRATVARADLPVRLADPAFTGGEARPDLSGGGHGTPQHGQPGSRPAPTAEVFGAVGRRYPSSAPAVAAVVPLASPPRLLSAVA